EPLSNRFPQTPQLLSNLVDRMLVKDPKKRIQSWTEVLAGLRSASAALAAPQKKKLTLNKPTDARNRLPQKAAPPKKKGSLLYWIIAAFFTILLIVMAIILKTSQSKSVQSPPATSQRIWKTTCSDGAHIVSCISGFHGNLTPLCQLGHDSPFP
ncbi:MAG: hypothetical protein IJT83_03300, partial [Victivallales bacterium]|nr:hypothetical protein [Victivallales bacterium]